MHIDVIQGVSRLYEDGGNRVACKDSGNNAKNAPKHPVQGVFEHENRIHFVSGRTNTSEGSHDGNANGHNHFGDRRNDVEIECDNNEQNDCEKIMNHL